MKWVDKETVHMMSTAHDKDMEFVKDEDGREKIKFCVFSTPKVWVGWVLVTTHDDKQWLENIRKNTTQRCL
jgi:hypothetical protein